jgi:hypothetical protein
MAVTALCVPPNPQGLRVIFSLQAPLPKLRVTFFLPAGPTCG